MIIKIFEFKSVKYKGLKLPACFWEGKSKISHRLTTQIKLQL